MFPLPSMREFRTHLTDDGIVHLVFDMPGRSMNVFSNAAIHEIEAFADWLAASDVAGVVISSGKASAFCAGADLGELGAAYDMIVAAPARERTRVARDHFAPIGRAFRKLETAGKPVAAAIAGLALGGGCEFALGCHYRVMADTPQAALGLPESLVGLFPGGGGTQRMPRLVGLEASLPVLLEGARLSPAEALAAGAADEVVPPGGEVAAAERWIRRSPPAAQPWDRPEWKPATPPGLAAVLVPLRQRILTESAGHYPAPLAIIDCLERGLPQAMDDAVATEIDIFADLIQRAEPRNMIQTLFLGKQDFDKRRKAGGLPGQLAPFVADIGAIFKGAREVGGGRALAFLGLVPTAAASAEGQPAPDEIAARGLEWLADPRPGVEAEARRIVAEIASTAAGWAPSFAEEERRLADYATIRELGFPAYLGGPFALLAAVGGEPT